MGGLHKYYYYRGRLSATLCPACCPALANNNVKGLLHVLIAKNIMMEFCSQFVGELHSMPLCGQIICSVCAWYDDLSKSKLNSKNTCCWADCYCDGPLG